MVFPARGAPLFLMSTAGIGPRVGQCELGKSAILSHLYPSPIPHDYLFFRERVVFERPKYISLHKITVTRSTGLSPGIGTRLTFRCTVQGGSI